MRVHVGDLPNTSCHRSNRGTELVHVAWLDQIVVDALVQPGNAILKTPARGQGHDPHRGVALPQTSGDGQPIFARQTKVENQDRPGVAGVHGRVESRPFREACDVKTLTTKVEGHVLEDVWVIFNDSNGGHREPIAAGQTSSETADRWASAKVFGNPTDDIPLTNVQPYHMSHESRSPSETRARQRLPGFAPCFPSLTSKRSGLEDLIDEGYHIENVNDPVEIHIRPDPHAAAKEVHHDRHDIVPIDDTV